MRVAWPPAVVQWVRRAHRRVFYPTLAVLFPTDCFVCREPLGAVQHLGACASCWAGLQLLEPPICAGCGLPRPETTDLLGPAAGRCAVCILAPPSTDGVRAVVAYDRVARAILLRAKLGRRPELLERLGHQLAAATHALHLSAGCSMIVPLPSHPWMTLRRGFSPARILARHVARRMALPLHGRLLVKRVGSPMTVKRLGGRTRRDRAAETFRVRGSAAGARLLLVDDVMTTGASIEGAARALKQAGAREVRAVAWARTLPTSSGRGPVV